MKPNGLDVRRVARGVAVTAPRTGVALTTRDGDPAVEITVDDLDATGDDRAEWALAAVTATLFALRLVGVRGVTSATYLHRCVAVARFTSMADALDGERAIAALFARLTRTLGGRRG